MCQETQVELTLCVVSIVSRHFDFVLFWFLVVSSTESLLGEIEDENEGGIGMWRRV